MSRDLSWVERHIELEDNNKELFLAPLVIEETISFYNFQRHWK